MSIHVSEKYRLVGSKINVINAYKALERLKSKGPASPSQYDISLEDVIENILGNDETIKQSCEYRRSWIWKIELKKINNKHVLEINSESRAGSCHTLFEKLSEKFNLSYNFYTECYDWLIFTILNQDNIFTKEDKLQFNPIPPKGYYEMELEFSDDDKNCFKIISKYNKKLNKMIEIKKLPA